VLADFLTFFFLVMEFVLDLDRSRDHFSFDCLYHLLRCYCTPDILDDLFNKDIFTQFIYFDLKNFDFCQWLLLISCLLQKFEKIKDSKFEERVKKSFGGYFILKFGFF
jgi:hypothetical protein